MMLEGDTRVELKLGFDLDVFVSASTYTSPRLISGIWAKGIMDRIVQDQNFFRRIVT